MLRAVIITIVVIIVLTAVGLVVSGLFVSPVPGSITASPSLDGSRQPGGDGQSLLDTTDSDSDGLPNAQESIWGTDANKADSDSDGYLDGLEVTNRYNPLVRSPGDKLPEGFVPGSTPLAQLRAAPQAIDQLFEPGVDLSGGTTNLNEIYNSRFPTEQRNDVTLAQFVQEQPIVTQLPVLKNNVIRKQPQDTSVNLINYLQVADNDNILANKTALSIALQQLIGANNTSVISALAREVRLYQERMSTQPIPPAAEYTHRLLLSYSQLLAATFDQVSRWNEDRVKAMVALRQLEEIDKTYYPLIQLELSNLRARQAQLP